VKHSVRVNGGLPVLRVRLMGASARTYTEFIRAGQPGR